MTGSTIPAGGAEIPPYCSARHPLPFGGVMAETKATGAEQTDAPAQSVNGRAPMPPDAAGDSTGERWLGVLVIAAGCFLLIVGIDRISGGRVSAILAGGGDEDG